MNTNWENIALMKISRGVCGGGVGREGEKGGRGPLCIAMCHNVLFDRWRTSFYVMAIMEWVHIAWTGCIIGNPS